MTRVLISRTEQEVDCGKPFTETYTAPNCEIWTQAYYNADGQIVNADLSNPKSVTFTFASVDEAKTLVLTSKPDKVAVNISNGANGSVNQPASSQVCRGENFSFTATPAAGYRIASVLINGVAQTFTESGDSFTISNIQLGTDIQVLYEPSTVTVTVVNGTNGTADRATSVVQIGSNFTVVFTPNTGAKISAIRINGVLQTALSPAGAYTHALSNIQTDQSISVEYVLFRQSAAYPAYPSNEWIHPIGFRNNGLEIWKQVRSGDSTTAFHQQGFGVDNAVTRIRWWRGATEAGMVSQGDYSTVRSDYRIQVLNNESFHKMRVDRADGGYSEVFARATIGAAIVRTPRIWISDVRGGQIVFSVITSTNGTLNLENCRVRVFNQNTGSELVNMNATNTNSPTAREVFYNNLAPGNYRVRLSFNVVGEGTHYSEFTYVII